MQTSSIGFFLLFSLKLRTIALKSKEEEKKRQIKFKTKDGKRHLSFHIITALACFILPINMQLGINRLD